MSIIKVKERSTLYVPGAVGEAINILYQDGRPTLARQLLNTHAEIEYRHTNVIEWDFPQRNDASTDPRIAFDDEPVIITLQLTFPDYFDEHIKSIGSQHKIALIKLVRNCLRDHYGVQHGLKAAKNYVEGLL